MPDIQQTLEKTWRPDLLETPFSCQIIFSYDENSGILKEMSLTFVPDPEKPLQSAGSVGPPVEGPKLPQKQTDSNNQENGLPIAGAENDKDLPDPPNSPEAPPHEDPAPEPADTCSIRIQDFHTAQPVPFNCQVSDTTRIRGTCSIVSITTEEGMDSGLFFDLYWDACTHFEGIAITFSSIWQANAQ
ncbi:hypothetical protein OOT00_05600 [Desulfobotulus sp. H1]|uniref:Uncharacterized protein n=1 Tax=Desulfobotulus pelophilus TaxID=2823377 RepID=A0ABT3N7N1_9BACT|nr:hypothetical protein [Desulfobotulus pelophilus]MCW7753461.1 hypothetical protein [Desulfobotulus pelophilus]